MHARPDNAPEAGILPGPPPHGGSLVSCLASPDDLPMWLDRIGALPRLEVGPETLSDLECLAVGAFSPLRGFMTRADFQSVVGEMRLKNKVVWSLPITLPIDQKQLTRIGNAEHIALSPAGGDPLAILHVEEIFAYDRGDVARHVFRTEDPSHPGVAALAAQGDHLIGGPVTVLSLPPNRPFLDFRLTPAEVRLQIANRGWRTVTGFHTRNPIYRAHEYLTKCALESVDGLLLHPLIGETKLDDFSAATRMDTYRALVAGFYPANRVLLSVFVAVPRYAGPREAVFHALCRKNYGCTHFIVGRDHAGVGNFYGSFEAHEIFREFTPEEIGITPIFFDHAFWCRLCGQIATAKTCPHSPEERVVLSGTEVRRRLSNGEDIPQEFSRPQVAALLREALFEESEQPGGALSTAPQTPTSPTARTTLSRTLRRPARERPA
jgi:sulfate adenylyltransferase